MKIVEKGYPLENRSYQSDDINYKFTGKQRDAETGYGYFGARYYDARIANWGSVDPLFEKHIGWNPYNYVLRNPMTLIDPDGRQLVVTGGRKENDDINDFYTSLDIKGLNYNNGVATFSGDYSDLDEDEKLIVDLIQGNSTFVDKKTKIKMTLTVEAKLLDKDYFYSSGGGFPQITNCESYGEFEQTYNENGTANAIQYFHMGIINVLDEKGVFYKTEIIRHGLVEAILGAWGRLPYVEADNAANEVAKERARYPYIGVGYSKNDKGETILKARREDTNVPEDIYKLDMK